MAKQVIYRVHRRLAVSFQFYHTKCYDIIPTGPPNAGVECRGHKNCNFRPISRFISEIIKIWPSYYETPIGTRMDLSIGAISNDLE